LSFIDFFRKGLKKTRDGFFKRIASILKGSKLNEVILEEVEELLILADVGVETSHEIVELLQKCYREDPRDPLELAKDILKDILKDDASIAVPERPPLVISVVGVNGTGKTTTIAKLAHLLKRQGKEVVLAAADTFRAAAIEQLKSWGERIGATVISQRIGSDAGAVAYDAVNHALSKGKDVVIVDTAGRLHTKYNLMEELKKVHRVIAKSLPGAPHEVLLVIDATTGQNGLIQAMKFKEAVNVTGVVITKLDGTAKGGIVIPIRQKLDIPIKFMAFGEGLEDLKPFSATDFVEALFD